MIQAQLVAPRQFAFVELPQPRPEPGQVLLEIGSVAVCGSEFAPYLGLATEFPLYQSMGQETYYLCHQLVGNAVFREIVLRA